MGGAVRVAGVDQSNRQCGLAILDCIPGRRPLLLELVSLPGAGSGRQVETARRVLDRLEPRIHAFPQSSRIRIEQAPPSGSQHHGQQAVIGWSLGLLAGLILGGLRDYDAELVTVSAWRTRMLEVSTRWGVLAQAPPKSPPPPPLGAKPARKAVTRAVSGPGFEVRFEGCTHVTPVADYGALMAFTIPVCPQCGAATRAKRIDPDWRRGEWKRLACRLVAAHWPEPYAALVASARASARVEHEDHELAGVSDACEAVWIALSAWELS